VKAAFPRFVAQVLASSIGKVPFGVRYIHEVRLPANCRAALNSQCEDCHPPIKLGCWPVLHFGFEMLQDEQTDGRG
jgi:hypothetical protein